MRYFLNFLFFSLSVIAACNPDHRNSEWTPVEERLPNGVLARSYWLKNGVKDSTMLLFNPKGEKIGIMRFKDGVQQGISQFFYPSGQLKETQTIVDGKREGKVTTWFESGQTQTEAIFQNDKMNGRFKRWNPEGQLVIECIFENDSLRQVLYQMTVPKPENQ